VWVVRDDRELAWAVPTLYRIAAVPGRVSRTRVVIHVTDKSRAMPGATLGMPPGVCVCWALDVLVVNELRAAVMVVAHTVRLCVCRGRSGDAVGML
jgi:hypothetical protein